MKINKLLVQIMTIVSVLFIAAPINCMVRRNHQQAAAAQHAAHLAAVRRAQQARWQAAPHGLVRPQGAAPRPANHDPDANDERIRAATAESLAEEKEREEIASGKYVQSPATVEEISRSPEFLETFGNDLNNIVVSLYEVCPEALYGYIGTLEEKARQLMSTLTGYVGPFLNAVEDQEVERCKQIKLKIDYLKAQLQTILHFLRSMERLATINDNQPVASDFPIPACLRVPGLPIIRHLKTGGQKGATCGAHATIYGCSVQQILADKKQVTGEELRARVATLNEYIQKENLSELQIYELTARLKLQSGFAFAFNDKKGDFYETNRAVAFDRHASRDQIFAMIKASLAGDFYFVLNTGGHWVTVAVIKFIGQPAQIIYMDSGNGKLDEAGLPTQFIKYLINSIFGMNL